MDCSVHRFLLLITEYEVTRYAFLKPQPTASLLDPNILLTTPFELRVGRPSGRSSSPGRVMNFLLSMSSRLALGSTQPPTQWVPRALSPGVKRPGREADHSPSASAKVKKMWIYTSTPSYAFMA
jgi:hypothetical protein